jgi:hypothetical protein
VGSTPIFPTNKREGGLVTQMTWTVLFYEKGTLRSRVFHGEREIELAKREARNICGEDIIAMISGRQNVFLNV